MSDLINREDAIKAVAEVLSLNRFASFKDIKDFHRFAERVLRNVPSADRPQGEWIPSDTDGFVCSVCKNGYRNQPTLMGRPMFEYCPVCGARMKGADDD